MNNSVIIIAVFVGLIIVLLFLGATFKPLKWLGQGIIRFALGALFLFLLNSFGSEIDIHIPINFVTAGISGFLGIPGMLALVAIQQFILP